MSTQLAPDRKDQLKALTSLRFFTAFFVFMFHVNIRAPLIENDFCRSLVNQGAIGMSFFFILSGFILTHAHLQEIPFDYGAYFKKRFARIYPAYLFATVLAFPFFLVQVKGLSVDRISKIYILAFNVVANALSLQGWFPQLFDYWINNGTWSLTVEWFLYLLFPLILLGLSRLGVRRLQVIAVSCVALSSMVGFSSLLPGADSFGRVFYSLPFYRLFEFVLGVSLAILKVKHQGMSDFVRRFAGPLIVAGGMTLIAYLGLFGLNHGYVFHNFMVVPILGLIILAASYPQKKGVVFRILENPVLVLLGEASYSFYLLQLPVFSLFHYSEYLKALPPIRYFLLALGMTLVSSLLCHRFVEKPGRRFLLSERFSFLPDRLFGLVGAKTKG